MSKVFYDNELFGKETKVSEANFHTNAARLIVTAAEKSSLLQEIAQALRYVDTNNPTRHEGCLACTLCSALVDAFVIDVMDDHDALVTNVLEIFYGEGFVIPEASEEEVARYLGVSSASPTTPHNRTVASGERRD